MKLLLCLDSKQVACGICRCIMEKRRRKAAEDELWRANKAVRYTHRHMNVDAFSDYRCRDDDEEPARHYRYRSFQQLFGGVWRWDKDGSSEVFKV